MKQWWSMIVALAAVLAVTSLSFAASPSPSPALASKVQPATVEVEGKVLTVGKGWVEVEVTKIVKGQGLRQGEKIKFREAARLKILQKGKAMSLRALKAGEIVEVSATVAQAGKNTTYTATSITIMQ